MIIIRCDSSYDIGTGHVVRCLNLARSLQSISQKVEFICQDLPGNIIARIEDGGFKVHRTNQDLPLIEKLQPSWVVVDQYYLDKQWEQKARQTAKLFVIDDLLREHDCDVLLDQNFRTDYSVFNKLAPADCQFLVGPKYCLLPPELEREISRKLNFSPFKVVVFFGGVDERNDLTKFYQSLVKNKNLTNIFCQLVALSSHKHLGDVQSLKPNANCEIIINPKNWHSLLKNASFFIGSGGTVTWERLFLGTPGAVIAVADNQVAVSQQVASAGMQYYWGDSKHFNFDEAIENLRTLSQRHDELRQISQKGMQFVEGMDAQKLNKFFN